MRISDWSSDVCSSDLLPEDGALVTLEIESEHARVARENLERAGVSAKVDIRVGPARDSLAAMTDAAPFDFVFIDADKQNNAHYRSEEHTSELQSLMRSPYAVFCLIKKKDL